MADRDDDYKEGEEVDDNYNPEEEVGGNWAVSVNLPEVPLVTGEENDEVIVKFRSKLYRFADKQWKERGIGEIKLLKNKDSNKIRVLMRQEKTHKLVANHLVLNEGKLCQLEKLQTSDKAWYWDCYDCADEAGKFQRLCAKFTSVEDFNKFKEEFIKAGENNKLLKEKEAAAKTETKEEKKQD